MTRHLALLHLARLSPVPLPGRMLHRAGLDALASGCPGCADALFERAALAYRRELRVERLARVRVHQAIARVRAGRAGAGEEGAVAIERALTVLPRIEALVPPFEEIDARRLLAAWDHAPDAGAASRAA
jgi:hypothetical protein